MPKQIASTSALLLALCFARASAQSPAPLSQAERDLKRLDAVLDELSRGGDHTESRRPLTEIFEQLSRTAADLSRSAADAPPERRRELEAFARDAEQAARDERAFWRGTDASRPTLSSRAVAELRDTRTRLTQDLLPESPGHFGVPGRGPGAGPVTAAQQARQRFEQTQQQAARARALGLLQSNWEGKQGSGPGSGQRRPTEPSATQAGACPQCNARSQPAGLHTGSVPPLAAKPAETHGIWDSITGAYNNVVSSARSAYSTAVFVKRKMEEATGPVVSGVLEGVAETAAGITIGTLLWAFAKLLGKLVLGGLLSESGVGEVILIATLNTILIGIGVYLTGKQLKEMARAWTRWRASEPGTAASKDSLRDFVRSATVAVLSIALIAIGAVSTLKTLKMKISALKPPVVDTPPLPPPPPPPDEPVGGNRSKITPPDPRISGSKDSENAIDEYLRARGHTVESNPREGEHGAGRQGDRYVDGKLTEYKTISGVKNPDVDNLSGAISRRVMDGRGQAPNIIVDTRLQPAMTPEIAQRGTIRAFGADKEGKIASIRVIGKDFDITTPRKDPP